MRLARLAAAIGREIEPGQGLRQIRAISHDSRQVGPGSLFVAIAGTLADGHDFVGRAIEAGAVAVVSQRPLPLPNRVAAMVVPDSRLALAKLARCFYGAADRRLGLIGVTGTDGKTTTGALIAHLIGRSGSTCGLISTALLGIGGELVARSEHETTPSALRVNSLLAQMAAPYPDRRPQVISAAVRDDLDRYLGFRHRFRNIYGPDLEWSRMVGLLHTLGDAHRALSAELGDFCAYLRRHPAGREADGAEAD